MENLEALPIITVCPQQSVDLKVLNELGYGNNWRSFLTGKVKGNYLIITLFNINASKILSIVTRKFENIIILLINQ